MRQNSNKELDYLLLNLVEGKQQPEMNVALTKKQQKSVRNMAVSRPFKGHHWQEFGPGVRLYFSLLKYLAILFGVLLLNSLPSLICNLKGDGLSIYRESTNATNLKLDLMRISLANIAVPATITKQSHQQHPNKAQYQSVPNIRRASDNSDDDKIDNDNNKSFDHNSNNDNHADEDADSKKQLTPSLASSLSSYSSTQAHRFIVMLNDLLITVIVLVFLVFWNEKTRQIIAQRDQVAKSVIGMLPSYRTLVISNLDVFTAGKDDTKGQEGKAYKCLVGAKSKGNSSEHKEPARVKGIESCAVSPNQNSDQNNSDTDRKLFCPNSALITAEHPQSYLRNQSTFQGNHSVSSTSSLGLTEAIWRHFGRLGRVESVTVIYDYGEILYELNAFNKLAMKYSEEQDSQKVKLLYSKLEDRFYHIKALFISHCYGSISKESTGKVQNKSVVDGNETKQNKNDDNDGSIVCQQLQEPHRDISVLGNSRASNELQLRFKPFKAFVTFSTSQDRQRVRALYKYKLINLGANSQPQIDLGISHSLSLSRRSPSKVLFGKSSSNLPRVKSCHTQPVSIIWENFHRKPLQDLRTTVFIGCFLVAILAVALVAILLLSIKMAGLVDSVNMLNRNNIDVDSDQTQLQDGSTISVPQSSPQIQHPSYLQALQSSNQVTVYNFCSGLSLTYENLNLDYYSLCEEYFTNFTQTSLTMLVLSALVLAINLVLNRIVYALADYRRHRTVTQKNRFLIVNIFVVYFVNMVLLTLLIRADFGKSAGGLGSEAINSNSNGSSNINGHSSFIQNSYEHINPSHNHNHNSENSVTSLIDIVRSIFPQFESHRKVETYGEFTRKWYIHIGNQLVLNYIVSLVLCPWLYIVLYWLYERALNPWLARTARSQTQLNLCLQGQSFDFETFYGMLLNSFFCCMLFGTAMPLFYLLGAISFLSMYWSSEYIFFHYCRAPHPFDHSINTFISKMLLFALAAHQLMAISFLFVTDVFPEKAEGSQNGAAGHQGLTFTEKAKEGWIFLLVLVFVVIFYFFKKEITNIIVRKYYAQKQKKQQKQVNVRQKAKSGKSRSAENKKQQGKYSGLIEQNELPKPKTKKDYNQKQVQGQMEGCSLEYDCHNPDINPVRQNQGFNNADMAHFYRMEDNPAYLNLFYTLTVFEQIVKKSGQNNEIPSFKSFSDGLGKKQSVTSQKKVD